MPADSSPEESLLQQQQQVQTEQRSRFSPWSSSPGMSQQPSPFLPTEMDRDMDMMLDAASPPPTMASHTQDHLEPGAFHHEPLSPTVAGRMPTPILPSFAAQVRGSAWGGPGPTLNHLHLQGVVNLGHYSGGLVTDDRSIPRTMESCESEWHSVQRRLPSPISEGDDNCNTSGGCVSPPGMVLDAGFPNQFGTRIQDHTIMEESMMPREYGMMDFDAEPLSTASVNPGSPTQANSAPATPSSGRKGHIRSRHTVNTWTWQPGMKKSFSIGYRADCEKCRLKVPGHFNHIIVS
jgi:hypothetical protein